VILVADKQHRTFVTRLLLGLGYPRHKLRILPLPAGEGSGEQYVREHYASEVRELRRRRDHLHQALVVMTDTDEKETRERLRQLAEELSQAALAPRTATERIALLAPCRNIETWITYLLGQPVNEADFYPRLTRHERDCQPAVDRLLELYRSSAPLPVDCPPSLAAAIEELRRLA
jgi:hypothetical protein